jgi:cell wall-associated NlpC family hydrolase
MAQHSIDQEPAAGTVRLDWPSRYIGVPYAERGFDFDGCNCWGLVHLVLKTECGIETPTYGEISALDLLRSARAFRDGRDEQTWLPVMRAALQPFDGVMMRSMTDSGSRVENHVGIIAPTSNGLRILHIWETTEACLMKLDDQRAKIVGFYRHRELA